MATTVNPFPSVKSFVVFEINLEGGGSTWIATGPWDEMIDLVDSFVPSEDCELIVLPVLHSRIM